MLCVCRVRHQEITTTELIRDKHFLVVCRLSGLNTQLSFIIEGLLILHVVFEIHIYLQIYIITYTHVYVLSLIHI